ncbi:GntR family transcriptional regulator [Cohnella xylanilytica]|uniref:GntR family transcriptional regulator n=1 Tax=Cohnella xylanilytica TaxID=557555 RepID=UPI0024849970|nr:GntR family transcriptional regulator [Cohnella xylanilytica]
MPLYYQLKQLIMEKLKELPPLSPIPSERELCDTFGVSRPTVRRALEELENDGELVRLPGKGTFVAEKKYVDHAMQWSIGFYEDASMQNKAPTTKVLQQTIVPATAEIAKRLAVQQDSEVFVLERLRFVDGEPICLVTSYLPYALCTDLPKANFAEQSLYAFLKEYGIAIHRAKRSIEVKQANVTEAAYLNIEKDSPIVLFQSLGFMKDGTPFEYVRSRYPAYKARFENEVFQPAAESELP